VGVNTRKPDNVETYPQPVAPELISK